MVTRFTLTTPVLDSNRFCFSTVKSDATKKLSTKLLSSTKNDYNSKILCKKYIFFSQFYIRENLITFYCYFSFYFIRFLLWCRSLILPGQEPHWSMTVIWRLELPFVTRVNKCFTYYHHYSQNLLDKFA